ncbi:hypothetical protein D3C76_1616130 [compost metagenome]
MVVLRVEQQLAASVQPLSKDEGLGRQAARAQDAVQVGHRHAASLGHLQGRQGRIGKMLADVGKDARPVRDRDAAIRF